LTTGPPEPYSIIPTSNATFVYSSTNATWPPTATQTGIASNCMCCLHFSGERLKLTVTGQRWYEVQPGDTCQSIANMYATTITLMQL
jgi:hypothetical protein